MNIVFTNTQKRSLRLLLQLAKLNLSFKPTHLFYIKHYELWVLTDESSYINKNNDFFIKNINNNYHPIDICKLPILAEDALIDIREFY